MTNANNIALRRGEGAEKFQKRSRCGRFHCWTVVQWTWAGSVVKDSWGEVGKDRKELAGYSSKNPELAIPPPIHQRPGGGRHTCSRIYHEQLQQREWDLLDSGAAITREEATCEGCTVQSTNAETVRTSYSCRSNGER